MRRLFTNAGLVFFVLALGATARAAEPCKLAMLGGRLVASTAQKLAGQFFENFSAKVSAGREFS